MITTIRVGQLPSNPFNLSDNLPHEIGTELNRGTIQQLVDLISTVLLVSDGVGFRSVSVTDGQTLPTTTKQEFILVGKGTYYNVAGGQTIVLNEELNALVSNGSFWFVGVEIPINIELAGITQQIREGFTTTTPSEDTVFKALALKLNNIYANKFVANGILNTFTLPNSVKAISVYIDRGIRYKGSEWNQLNNEITILGDILPSGSDIYITGLTI